MDVFVVLGCDGQYLMMWEAFGCSCWRVLAVVQFVSSIYDSVMLRVLLFVIIGVVIFHGRLIVTYYLIQ